MKKIPSIYLLIAAVIFLGGLFLQTFLPNFIYAATVQSPSNNPVVQSPSSPVTIDNPIKPSSIQCLISYSLRFVVDLLAIAAVLYIIWAGFLFVKAQGNPDELTKAKTAFMHALIGTAIILGAWALATVIANTINKITKSNVNLPAQNQDNC